MVKLCKLVHLKYRENLCVSCIIFLNKLISENNQKKFYWPKNTNYVNYGLAMEITDHTKKLARFYGLEH